MIPDVQRAARRQSRRMLKHPQDTSHGSSLVCFAATAGLIERTRVPESSRARQAVLVV